MSILSSIGRVATRYAQNRARHRSERELLALPIELRKDIGWPEIVIDAHNDLPTKILDDGYDPSVRHQPERGYLGAGVDPG